MPVLAMPSLYKISKAMSKMLTLKKLLLYSVQKEINYLSKSPHLTLSEDMNDDFESSESLPQKGGSYRLAGLLGSTNDLLNTEAKSKRLRQSAKKSRLRKKIYLKLLEKKVSDLD